MQDTVTKLYVRRLYRQTFRFVNIFSETFAITLSNQNLMCNTLKCIIEFEDEEI